MTVQLRVLLGVAVIVYFFLIIKFIKKRLLALKYALLWFFTGLVMGLLVLFPQAVTALVSLLGIQLAVNGIFLLGIAFSLMLIMSITVIVSHQTERIRSLAQDNAILEKRIRDLEKKMS